MPLCFIDPADAIRAIADSIGREARRQLLGEVVRAWVDEIPDDELQVHYAKAVDELDDDDLSMLAAWHASLEVGQPIANKEFLLGAFPRLGEHRREALRIAAGFKGDDAFEAGISEEQIRTDGSSPQTSCAARSSSSAMNQGCTPDTPYIHAVDMSPSPSASSTS